jgi:hypothetical protein
MNFLKPWLWYLLSALIMCVVYCGLEKANDSLGLTAKSVLCVWSILSLTVTVALLGLQTYIDTLGSLPPMQVSGATLGASCITLCISSCCVYSAY